MAIYFKTEDLFPVVSHHISVMERLKEDTHEFALACFKMNVGDKEIEEILRKSLRKTDIVSNVKNYYIVFLPFTDYHGAYQLLKGINKFLNQTNKESIVAFPEDGKNAFQMIEKFTEKIDRHYGININFF